MPYTLVENCILINLFYKTNPRILINLCSKCVGFFYYKINICKMLIIEHYSKATLWKAVQIGDDKHLTTRVANT